ELKLSGRWTSPGGEVKLFTADTVSLKWHGKTIKTITLAGNSTETYELSKILTSICESSVENQGSNTERCQDYFDNDDNTEISMDATSGKRLNTTGLYICNDQESLENSFNKSGNTIADETNSGDGMLENIENNKFVMTDETNSGDGMLENIENNKFVMTDNSCQTNNQTAKERWGLNHSCTLDQVTTDIDSLTSKMSTLQSSVLSFENVLKDHDTILSLYKRAADLNEKYLVEINEKTRYINSLEQKLIKIEEERDSLQLATRLIAQDKLCQHRGNSVSCQCRKSNPVPWQKIPNSNKNFHKTNSVSQPQITYNRYECLIDEDEIAEVVQPEQSAQCPPEHTSHPTGNECLIVEGETDEIVQPEQSSQCPPEHTNHPTGNVYQNPNHPGDQSARPCVVLIGDSIITNIIPQKLSQKRVHKFTYPDKSADEIEFEIRNIDQNLAPSHVILHCGTNNLPTDDPNVCARQISQCTNRSVNYRI
ncbi:Hypothetical predicted protein, partial [Paramuricea clavata]